MYYSGVDLHSDNCFITTIDDTGTVVKQQRVENISELILDYFHSLQGSLQAVVESTTGWYWLNDLLQDNGIELVLAHAKYLKIAFSDAAVHAIQYYPEHKRFYQKLARRSSEATARTVVAKGLAKIVYYVLKNKTQYKGLKGQPISRQRYQQWPRLASSFA